MLGLTVAALLAFGAVQAADLWMKRVQALQAADSRARNLAYILGEYVRGSFAVADTSLRQLAIHGRRVGGAAAPDAEWRPILLSAREALPGSGSISIAGADGSISHSTNPGLIGQARHNQFLYRHLSTLGRDEFVVDTPFLTPGPNPRYLLPIGRRLESVSGGFDGVAVATVGPETYREFFRSVDVGADGVAWVFHPEGFIVFREP